MEIPLHGKFHWSLMIPDSLLPQLQKASLFCLMRSLQGARVGSHKQAAHKCAKEESTADSRFKVCFLKLCLLLQLDTIMSHADEKLVLFHCIIVQIYFSLKI